MDDEVGCLVYPAILINGDITLMARNTDPTSNASELK